MSLEYGYTGERFTKNSTKRIVLAILGAAVVISVGLAIGLAIGLRSSGGVRPRSDAKTGSTGDQTAGDSNTDKNDSYAPTTVSFINTTESYINTTDITDNTYICGNTTEDKTTEPLYKSGHGTYRFATVAADSSLCSKIGTEVMARRRGNVIDATVATVICNGVMNAHSAGIGGGSFIVYYDRKARKVITVNARETAPGAATADMFFDNSGLATKGGKAIGVPGELKGLWYLHQNYGSLDWASLLQPTIDLCYNGFELTIPQQAAGVSRKDDIKDDPEFNFLFDSAGEVVPAGTKVFRPKLGHTLEVIAREGANAFYNGTLTDQIAAEIQEAGGIITRQDLENYKVDVPDPVTFDLTSPDLKMYSMPPPGGGVVVQFILNILSGYGFGPESISDTEKSVLTYHRIVEAMKFAYAKRTALGDAQFVNVSEVVANMTSHEYGEEIRAQIDDEKTHDTSYYGPSFSTSEQGGTAHFSFMDGEGNAVAMTSTINTYFGSKVKGNRTGIMYNNEMADFSTPNTTNFFGVPAQETNFIVPGKRPLSSMSPSIFVSPQTGDVKLVVGAAGGSFIITAVAKVSMDTLWFNKTITAAVDAPRIHHQLLPAQIILQTGFPADIQQGLEAKGHVVTLFPSGGSVVTAIARTREGTLESVSDYRKYGSPDGF